MNIRNARPAAGGAAHGLRGGAVLRGGAFLRSAPRRARGVPLFCVLLGAPLAAFSSCGSGSLFTHEVEAVLPARPPAWVGMERISYVLRWVDETGTARSAQAAEGETARLRLRRGARCAVLAEASFDGVPLRPAGGLYPWDLGSAPGDYPSSRPDTLRMSYESGYAASTAVCIEAAGYDPWVYPLEKLRGIWSERRRDAWSVPPQRAARDLLDGTFRINAYRTRLTAAALPSDAFWWPESPMCLVEGPEDAQIASLPEGLWRFYSSGETLLVEVSGGAVETQRVRRAAEGE